MANIKSSIHRIQVTKRNTLQNKKYFTSIKTYIKKYLYILDTYNKQTNELHLKLIFKYFNFVYSQIDKAKKFKILSKNIISLQKSNLRRLFILS